MKLFIIKKFYRNYITISHQSAEQQKAIFSAHSNIFN